MTPAPPLPLRVCPKHGLVAGRDGRCVICHRNDADGGRDVAGRRRLAGGLLVLVALMGTLLVWKGVRGRAPAGPTVIRGDVPVAAPAPPPTIVDDEEQGPAPRTPEEARERIRRDEQQQRQRALEAEVRRVPVRMFTVKTCPMCDLARDLLKQKGLSYREDDVEADPSALAAMRALTPSTQVPVFDVDGEVLVGYNPINVLAAVHRAAERRTRPR
jgi:glutaredoxin 3